MAEQLVCVHCENHVVEIDYGEGKQIMRGELVNKYKHSFPLLYQPCVVNPLMDEDVKVEDA